MEHDRLMHLPFAKGRIENGLAPAPRRLRGRILARLPEALSVLAGRSIAVRCYEDMEPPEGEEQYVDGLVGNHPILMRQADKEKGNV